MSDVLLAAVDALTLPHRFKQIQDTKLVVVELPPLLTQLDEAIRSSLGGSAAGASLASESSLVNSAALMKLMQISTQVADWCRIRHLAPVRGDTSGNLRRWYTTTLAGEFEPAFYTLKLDQWATEIQALFDPPRQWDLADACPAEDCGADRWWKDKHEGGLRPLVVLWRPGVDVALAKVMCRACGKTWGVRELKYILEQKPESADSETGGN